MNPWRNVTLFFMFANFYVNPWYNVTYFLCVWISLRPWSVLSLSFYACDFFYQSEPNNNETEKQGTEMKGGVMVSKVTQGSPADKTDLRIHDIITQVRLLSGKKKERKEIDDIIPCDEIDDIISCDEIDDIIYCDEIDDIIYYDEWWHHLLWWNWWHHSL